jgi:hypothetical protein
MQAGPDRRQSVARLAGVGSGDPLALRRAPASNRRAVATASCAARRSRLPRFVNLAQRTVRHRDAILASIEHGLSNALVESMNTKIPLIVRVAFGFLCVKAGTARRWSASVGTDPHSRPRSPDTPTDESGEPLLC